MATLWTLPSIENANPAKRDAVNQWVLTHIDYGMLKNGGLPLFHRCSSFYSTSLPDFSNWPAEHKVSFLRDIQDVDMQDDLQRAGLINWCKNVRRLVAIKVAKDGNCLLHAMGTAVWGITDKNSMLRKLLGLALNAGPGVKFHQRWQHQRELHISGVIDKLLESSTHEGLNLEWKEICGCPDPVKDGQSTAVPYRFLESIHIYVLANILRRPIIVYTDPTIRTYSGMSLQDNDMGGIYLPLEWPCTDTCRTPILIGYSHSHFAPLLLADYPPYQNVLAVGSKDLVPIVNSRFEQMPVRFLLKEEEWQVGELLRKYLKVKETVMQTNNVLCVEMDILHLPSNMDLVQDFVEHQQYQWHQCKLQKPVGHHHRPSHSQPIPSTGQPQYGLRDPSLQALSCQNPLQIPPPTFTARNSVLRGQEASPIPPQDKKCIVPSCGYFGDPELNMMCSRCFRNYSIKESRQNSKGALRAVQTVPSAPLATIMQPGEEEVYQTSMMAERCKEGCGFRCSVKTFPYCHECAGKIQRQAMEKMIQRKEPPAVGPLVNILEPVSHRPEHKDPSLEGILQPTPAPALTLEKSLTHVPELSNLSIADPALTPGSASVAAGCVAACAAPLQRQESANPSSPLQQLAAPPPLTPPDDTNDLMLFGSGHASELMTKLPSVFSGPFHPPSESETASSRSQPADRSKHRQEEAKAEAGSLAGNQDLLTSNTKMLDQQIYNVVTGEGDPLDRVKTNIQLVSPQPAVRQQEYWQPLRLTPSFPGQAEEPNQNCCPQQHVEPKPEQGEKYADHLEASSASSPLKCKTQNCKEEAVHRELCGQCYMSPGTGSPIDKLRQEVGSSSSSSAPPSIGIKASPVHGLKKSGHFQASESMLRASSLSNLPTGTQMPAQSKVSSWLSETCPPAMGLPENEETEVLPGKDLIASGSHCGSVTIYCIAEGCRNSVNQEGKLCEVCKRILRAARQGFPSHESQGSERYCMTEKCTYYGKPQTHGFCSKCYGELFERQVAAESRPIQPPVPSSPHPLTSPSMIHVPPDFHIRRPVPPERQGQQCCVPGCWRYGDPKNDNMCSSHYISYLEGTFGSVASGNVSPLPPSPLPGTPTHHAGAATQSQQHHPNEVNLKCTNASSVLLTPNSATVFASRKGDTYIMPLSAIEQATPLFATPETGGLYLAAQPGDLSVGPPSFPTPESLQGSLAQSPVVTGIRHEGFLDMQEPNLGETYLRVTGMQRKPCVKPGCLNYGNSSKGGLCNSCAEDQRYADEIVRRTILGEEQIG